MTVGLKSLAVSMASVGSAQKRNSMPLSSANMRAPGFTDHQLIVYEKHFDCGYVRHKCYSSR